MSEKMPVTNLEKKETLDDNARKFTVDTIDATYLEDNKATSFELTVDWLEIGEDHEKKVAHKKFDNGDVQILLISKVTKDGSRTSEKEAITEKQIANNEAINTVIANQQTLADDAQTLTTKQAELKVAELNLAAEKATAEGEKATLLEQKVAAEAEAKAAAEAEAAYKAQQQAQQQAVLASANTSFSAQVQAVNNTAAAPAAEATVSAPAVTQPAATVSRPTYSSSATTYPVGQCTWGAKTLAPWAGDYWGNGGQWAASAAAAGFRTGSQPQVGAIACWNDGGYGHVAVVTAVQSANNIQVSEANYAGNQSLGNHRGWFDPTNAQGYVTYIYPN